MRGRLWLWAAVAGLIAWGLIGTARGQTTLPVPAKDGTTDVKLYNAITARVAAGEPYYQVLAQELPARGYAIRPIFNWRLPTLTWINALPPSPYWGRAVLAAIGIASMVLWIGAMRRSFGKLAIASVPIIVLGTMPLLSIGPSIVFYEIWAGILIAASLAASGLNLWRTSVMFGAAALFIRELSALYVVVMVVMAWRESRRQELGAWIAVITAFAAFWLWHAWSVLQVLPATGLENSWVVAGLWPFVLKTFHASVFTILLPESVRHWVVAISMPVLWAGLWHWHDRLGRYVATVVTGYFALFIVAGRPDNWYWGFLIAHLIPIGAFGFFFSPDRRR